MAPSQKDHYLEQVQREVQDKILERKLEKEEREARAKKRGLDGFVIKSPRSPVSGVSAGSSSGAGSSAEHAAQTKVAIDPSSPRDQRALQRAKVLKELAEKGSPVAMLYY